MMSKYSEWQKAKNDRNVADDELKEAQKISELEIKASREKLNEAQKKYRLASSIEDVRYMEWLEEKKHEEVAKQALNSPETLKD